VVTRPVPGPEPYSRSLSRQEGSTPQLRHGRLILSFTLNQEWRQSPRSQSRSAKGIGLGAPVACNFPGFVHSATSNHFWSPAFLMLLLCRAVFTVLSGIRFPR
jgi:hypothetical protein